MIRWIQMMDGRTGAGWMTWGVTHTTNPNYLQGSPA